MNILTNPIFLEHDTGSHPENRKRIEVFSEPATQIPIDGSEYLELVHQSGYIKKVREACENQLGRLDGDTLVSARSYEAAVAAVGMTLTASNQGDFALVRPPGHHAYPGRASGFCLFNNIAIAVQAQVQRGKKVLIIDFDGHLGDGTSDIFYQSDDVLFFSMHQFPAFPGMGRSTEIGEKKGKGYTINIPLPPGSGDDIFLHAFRNYLSVFDQFQPDLIAVSAGFDAHRLDPLLQLNISLSSFYKLGKRIRKMKTPNFAVLEGGYLVEYLEKGVYNFLAGINGDDMPYEENVTTSNQQIWQQYEMDLHAGMSCLSPYWKF